EGADRLASAIEANLSLQSYGPETWRPPILTTTATTGSGIPALVASITAFRAHAAKTQAARRRERGEYRLRDPLARRFIDHLEQKVLAPGELQQLLDRIAARELDPYTAADTLVRRMVRS